MTQREAIITELAHQITKAVLAGRRDPSNVLMEIISEWAYTGRREAAYIDGLTARSYMTLKTAVRKEVAARLHNEAAIRRLAAR